MKKYAILALLFMVPLTYAVVQKLPEFMVENNNPRVEILLQSPEGEKVYVIAEIAATDEQRKKGLMNRQSMGDNEGMLFVWNDKAVRSFWMLNTFIPLDMIFLDDTHVIGTVENAEPHTLVPRTVGKLGNAVLEVNAGFVEKYGITSQWKAMYGFTEIVVE
tara:strand:- start:37088 stop:37570 length:483 start_codon:yes stop_codon:yes gene_type:complete